MNKSAKAENLTIALDIQSKVISGALVSAFEKRKVFCLLSELLKDEISLSLGLESKLETKAYQIMNWANGTVIFSFDCESFKVCLEVAVLKSIDLRFADLQGRNLKDADLRGGNFRGAKFNGSELTNAKWSGADLYETEWRDIRVIGIWPDEIEKAAGKFYLSDKPDTFDDIMGDAIIQIDEIIQKVRPK